MNLKASLSTKHGIDLNKPNFLVSLTLIIILVIETVLIFKKGENLRNELWKSFDAIIFVFAYFVLLTTPIVEWLRNIYALFGWLLICVLWYLYKVEQDFLTAILPFSVLIYSQVSRLLFKSIMGYHPIHLLFYRRPVHRYSKLNNRKSTKTDYWYSIIYFVVGLVLTMFVFVILKK
jgi:hypothetical protein